MIRVAFVNRTSGRVNGVRIKRLISRASEILAGNARQSLLAVTVVFITRDESRRLKRRYLRRNRPANVLSFRYDGDGEILLAPAVIRAEARTAGEAYGLFLGKLALHGLLHLYGFHHEGLRRQARRFEDRERSLCRALGLA